MRSCLYRKSRTVKQDGIIIYLHTHTSIDSSSGYSAWKGNKTSAQCWVVKCDSELGEGFLVMFLGLGTGAAGVAEVERNLEAVPVLSMSR